MIYRLAVWSANFLFWHPGMNRYTCTLVRDKIVMETGSDFIYIYPN